MSTTPPNPSTAVSGPSRTRVAATVLGLTAVAALGLTACSSSGGSKATPSASASQTIVAPAASPTSPQHPIPSDNEIVEQPELRKTIALTGCSAVDGGWAGTGTAKNPDQTEETYHILVFFTDKFSRTIDSATTDVKVAPGQTAKWSASTKFTPPQGTQCVLRGLSKDS